MPLERLNYEQVQQLHRKLFKVCGTNNLVVTLKFVDNTRICSFEMLTPLQPIYSVAKIELQNGTSILIVV